ncbi:hypothetical protein JIP62_13135 [Brevundimonas vitis]|uniref:Uncharacterized protein n=1 Tax=Brevundimonas vitisensis TaxID=2800818 RepID=A0ABX7BKZ0_9CAUL|nr:hypothetical protein [Brevundimonas vitisensis]QQQ18233.1 hypothetical protein JIP62_13135 [Brevundimonas vitisensis]
MFSLLLVLAVTTLPQDPQDAGALELVPTTCAVENGRWVCRYEAPATSITIVPPAATSTPAPAAIVTPPATSVTRGPSEREAWEARLIVRCADAGLVSLCSGAERRQARALREAEVARQALRREVTGLLSQNKCEDAVRVALEGGDLELAREARAFCAP